MKGHIKGIVMRTVLLTWCMTLCASKLYAGLQGQPLIDSLRKELPNEREDTNKVKLLYVLSGSYYAIAPDSGMKYGELALDLATKLEWKKGMALANNVLGINYQWKSDAPRALEYYFKALKLDEEIGYKKGISQVTGNIGIVYDRQNDYPKALEYDFRALKIDEELGNKSGIARNSGNIGIIYREQKNFDKASEYYFKALRIYEELGDKASIALNTGNIGVIYQVQKNYVMAVAYLQRALTLSEELGNRYGMAINLVNIGNTYLEIINDSASTKGIGRTTPANVKDDPELSLNKYQITASIPHGKAALLASAIDCEKRALAIGKEIKALDDIESCYGDLSKANKLKGDYKTAMEYADSDRVIRDSLFSEANRNQVAKLEKSREKYGDSLKVVAEKKTADIKAAHRRNYELIGAGVLLLALGFILLLSKNLKLLTKEKKRSDNLLLNILPEEVANQLKDTGTSAAKQFDDVTVLFTDFVNFTASSERMKPEVLLEELNICFRRFDEITHKYGIEKIKTIGDAYLAVGGLPTPDAKHAENTIRAAKEIRNFMEDRLAKLGRERTFEIRIGAHSGSVVAGIVGIKKFAYDIWGDTVNTAARMEQNSEAGKINISETTYALVKDKFECTYRGEIEAKGKGRLKMYYIF